MHITTCPRCQGRVKTIRVAPGFSYGMDRECASCGWTASRWEGFQRERTRCFDCGEALTQEDGNHYQCRACGQRYVTTLHQVQRAVVPAPTKAETKNF